MSLQKLTWIQFDPKNLDPKIIRNLKRIYDRYVYEGAIDFYISKMLKSIKHDLVYIVSILSIYKQELFQVEGFNVDQIITEYTEIINNIESENWEDISLLDLLDISAEIEMLFDESGLDEIVRGI